MNSNKEEVVSAAEQLYQQLLEAGIDVLFDDRKERPGVKFNDMDLIGFPVRIVVGQKGLANGEVELSLREDRERQMVPVGELVSRLEQTLQLLRQQLCE